ncbi:MAG: zinc-dependent alcohol dehydrogenase [Angustibacter sp.]
MDMVRAAIVAGQGRLELADHPEPVAKHGMAVVDITGCGICGSDLHAYQSGFPYPPALSGHEWTGTVRQLGAGVGNLSEGDRVVGAVPVACGRCPSCVAGHHGDCTRVLAIAGGRDEQAPPHGGFASSIGVTADRLMRIPTRLTNAQAALVEPTVVAFHAARRAGARLGDVVVIQGAGPVGLLALQWAMAAGAGRVVAIEPSPARRQLAEQLGATDTCPPGDAARQAVLEATGGLGADVVYECVGRPDAIQEAVELARRGGTVAMVGVTEQPATISPLTWLLKEIRTVAAIAYTREDFELAVGMLADGRIDVDPLHTATVGLDDLATTFVDLTTNPGDQIKVIVDPRR